MSLSNKYNIPEETVKRMVRDGVLSSKWPMYEEVYKRYQASNGKSNASRFLDVAIQMNIPERTVRSIVETMCKI